MRCSNINTIRTISHTFSSTAWPDTITRSHIIIHAPAWPHAPTTHAVDVTHPRFERARRPRSAFTVARIKVEPPPVPSGCPVNSTRPMANESAVAQLSDYRLPTLRANACLTWVWSVRGGWVWCQCGVGVTRYAKVQVQGMCMPGPFARANGALENTSQNVRNQFPKNRPLTYSCRAIMAVISQQLSLARVREIESWWRRCDGDSEWGDGDGDVMVIVSEVTVMAMWWW